LKARSYYPDKRIRICCDEGSHEGGGPRPNWIPEGAFLFLSQLAISGVVEVAHTNGLSLSQARGHPAWNLAGLDIVAGNFGLKLRVAPIRCIMPARHEYTSFFFVIWRYGESKWLRKVTFEEANYLGVLYHSKWMRCASVRKYLDNAGGPRKGTDL
jgi:hypothetical protein